jgi:hypothetical protein
MNVKVPVGVPVPVPVPRCVSVSVPILVPVTVPVMMLVPTTLLVPVRELEPVPTLVNVYEPVPMLVWKPVYEPVPNPMPVPETKPVPVTMPAPVLEYTVPMLVAVGGGDSGGKKLVADAVWPASSDTGTVTKPPHPAKTVAMQLDRTVRFTNFMTGLILRRCRRGSLTWTSTCPRGKVYQQGGAPLLDDGRRCANPSIRGGL